MADQDFDNTNRGALFRNDRRTNDRQPEYTGNLDVEGTQYWLSAWVRTSKTGQKFFSVAVTKKDAPRPVITVDEDELPF